MAAQQTSSKSLTSIAGALLLALGFLILFSNLDAAATQITNAAGSSGGRLLEIVPSLVLALLHGLQAYVFDHARFTKELQGFSNASISERFLAGQSPERQAVIKGEKEQAFRKLVAGPLPGLMALLAQADRARGHFHQLVVVDELEGLLEVELTVGGEADGVVGGGGPHVR